MSGRSAPSRLWRTLALSLPITLAAGLLSGAPASAKPKWNLPTHGESSVPGATAPHTAAKSPEFPEWKPTRKHWPAASTAEVDLLAAGAHRSASVADFRVAPGLPVSVARGASAAADPSRVQVSVLGREAAAGLGVDGLLMRVKRSDGVASKGTVSLRLDYRGFADTYGADWATRLRLIAIPDCALSTPELPACKPRPLPSRNDAQSGTVTADVQVVDETANPMRSSMQSASVQEESGGMMVAATSSEGGVGGNYGATSLSPSATWQSGTSTGDFSWSYSMRMPPSLGGPAPTVQLSYGSGSVDGRMSSANSQPSWTGEGWDYWPGFVERKHSGCAEDAGIPTGDQCYATDNATVSLNGKANELICCDGSGYYHLKNDDGSKVERLYGADNGDQGDPVNGSDPGDIGEHWKVTTPDGTQYFFGRNKLPGWTTGKPTTNSTWTVPVVGDDNGEPCHKTVYADSWCHQAYRWNLDHVIDPQGNVLVYYYDVETNRYGFTLGDQWLTYTRGGMLNRIEYGLRTGGEYSTTAPSRVTFTPADRCVTASCGTHDSANWPDTAWDQDCQTGTCPGRWAPTFWITKRLSKITTQVWRGSAYDDVDQWTLTHTFPNPGDQTTAVLWLYKLQHTGKLGTTDSAMPEIEFGGLAMDNRINTDGVAVIRKWRMTSIKNETGGSVNITYETPECTTANVVGLLPESNTKRCMPVRWTPPGQSQERLDWFHKYVVKTVDEVDGLGLSASNTTSYEYVGTPAWHFDDDDGIVPVDRKTWSQWRGFGQVNTRVGNATDGKAKTSKLFYRGMHGDKLNPSGGTKTFKVTDSRGVQVDDLPELQGQVRETISYTGDNTTVLSKRIQTGWVSPATVTSVRPWATVSAKFTNVSHVYTEGPVASGTRVSEVTHTIDGATGLVLKTEDLGEVKRDGSNNIIPDLDNECTRITYAPVNTAKWIKGLPARVEKYAFDCAQLPAAGAEVANTDVIMEDSVTYYDGSTDWQNGVPTAGAVSVVKDLATWSPAGRTYTEATKVEQDTYGRVTKAWDTAGKATTIAYTPTTGGPVTAISVTNTLGHVATNYLEPGNGSVLATVDANLRRTDFEYDGLGRQRKVWLPGRVKGTDSPNAEFVYNLRKTATSTVTTKALQKGGGYTTTIELYDGLLRPRQTQIAAPGGGRTLQDTYYNSRGQVIKQNGAYWNSAGPSTDVLVVTDANVPGQTRTLYDGAGRRTAEVFYKLNVEQWRTTAVHQGDRMGVIPAPGENASQVIYDTRGRAVELREFSARDLVSAYDKTTYTYNRKGEQTEVKDASGNKWTYGYDLRGRLTSTSDPDKGAASMTYTPAGDVESTTDSLGNKLFMEYDDLGRTLRIREGSATGTTRIEMVYDTKAKGLATSATRYINGNAYTTSVAGYDSAGRATGTSVTLPASEGATLGQTFTFGVTYNIDNTVATSTSPAIGGLPAETFTHEYTPEGLPTILRSNLGTLVEATSWSPFAEPYQFMLGAEATGKRVAIDLSYAEGSRRLTNIATLSEYDGSTLSNLAYTYDTVGNITQVVDSADGQSTDTQCFTYDHQRRLTQAWTPGNGNCGQAASNAAMGGPAKYWSNWTYDAIGNRKTQVRHNLAAGDETTTYTYPAAGAAKPHSLTSATVVDNTGTRNLNWGYDPAGNTTSRQGPTGNQTITWDPEGRIEKIVESGNTTSFVYDASGNRLLRKDPTGTTAYLGDTELKVKAGGALEATRYYNHAGTTVGVRTATGLQWIVANDQGTASLQINASNPAQVARRRFTPFGEGRGTAQGTWQGEQGFVGGTKDSSTGLTHLGARDYDAATGRFLSVDPVMNSGSSQEMHAYSYSGNNPITWSDPSGLMQDSGGGGGGGTGGDDTGGTTDVELPPDLQAMLDEANALMKKSLWDIILEAAGDILMEFLGINDIKDCFGKGDIVACISIVANIIPWGKIFKLPKLIKAIERAWTAVQTFIEKVKWARKVLAQVDEFRTIARKAAAEAQAARERAMAAMRAAQEKAAAAARKQAERARELAQKAKDKLAKKKGDDLCDQHSFVPGTKVLMADGSTRPIEGLVAGDKVVATNTDTGKTEVQTVSTKRVSEGHKTLVTVEVENADGSSGKLTVTDHHPFWLPQQAEWVKAIELTPGDALLTPDGSRVRVLALSSYGAQATVHNLTVTDDHTYYVLADTTPVLVHNCHKALGFDDPKRANPTAGGGVEDFADKMGADHFMNDANWKALVKQTIDQVGAGKCKISFNISGMTAAGQGFRKAYAAVVKKATVGGKIDESQLLATEKELLWIGQAGLLDKVDFYRWNRKLGDWSKLTN